jgi:hypothetical protein
MDYEIKQALKKSRRLLSRHPERIPVVVIAGNITMNMSKFLPHKDSNVGEFMMCVRGYIKQLQKTDALLLFVCETMPPMTTLMGTLYKDYATPDGYLHVHINRESTFG